MPGWYAISVNNLHENERLGRFLKIQPAAMAGYSIYLYLVTEDEAAGLNTTENTTRP